MGVDVWMDVTRAIFFFAEGGGDGRLAQKDKALEAESQI